MKICVKEKVKKLITLALTSAMVLGCVTPALADEIQPRTDGYYTAWEIDSVEKNAIEAIGTYELCYVGQPAQRAGEYSTASGSVTVTSGYSGSLKVGISELEAKIGYSTSQTITKTGSQNSAPLDVGEYVRAYVAPVMVYDKVMQHRYYRIDGYTTEETALCKPYRCTAVTIKFEYYQSNRSYSLDENNELEPYKTEVYLIDEDGNSTLLSKTEYSK